MRFSLREMLLVLTVASLAAPALYFANPTIRASSIAVVGLVILIASLHAVVDRGPWRAAALGFLTPALLYLLAIFASGNEGNPYRQNHILPTTTAMKWPLQAMVSRRAYSIDPNGKRVSGPPPQGAAMVGGGAWGGSFMGGGGFTNGGGWRYFSLPDQDSFVWIAHCLWTLFFGYLGMKYAVWIHSRSLGESAAAINSTTPHE